MWTEYDGKTATSGGRDIQHDDDQDDDQDDENTTTTPVRNDDA